MPTHDEAPLDTTGAAAEVRPVARRINVAVNGMMLAAIDRVIEREHVTLTEAVRRLIAYGDLVYEVTAQQNTTLLVRDPGGDEREVILL